MPPEPLSGRYRARRNLHDSLLTGRGVTAFNCLLPISAKPGTCQGLLYSVDNAQHTLAIRQDWRH